MTAFVYATVDEESGKFMAQIPALGTVVHEPKAMQLYEKHIEYMCSIIKPINERIGTGDIMIVSDDRSLDSITQTVLTSTSSYGTEVSGYSLLTQMIRDIVYM